MKKTVILSLFVLLLGHVFGQDTTSNYSLTVFGLPIVAPLNNLNGGYVLKSNTQANIIDNYSINQEWGISLNYQLKRKIKVGLGMSYKNYTYEVGVIFDKENRVVLSNNRVGIKHENSFTTKALGLRGLVNFNLSEKLNTNVSFILEFGKPISFNYTNSYLEDSTYYMADYRFQETFHKGIKKMDFYIIPEIHFSTEISHNIALSYGMKLKFWSKEYLYRLEIYEKKEPRFPVFKYEIDTRQLAFFVGLNYTFNFLKKEKPKTN
tara:strand:+ start:2764 stop:3555 length:792 start_codon:yes stop_codon:yes gene_type:complete